ncbi:restriction endonuclease subunit S [Bacteroides mediterraneensis]|uniref:restriction endonuclease subunit S n=1 Tax=Bacteroides mediterraneensis TaxID=1841856 RepID=UPI00195A9407|nr:restriction endonuclease subunit S [Bacteroides mediterraneensis]MBM6780171.1 restriction endonuclease subunit S [Bacteroides mediterraneensis]
MEELKTYKLEELTIGKGEYGIGASAVPFDLSKYTYLRITDINDDGTLNKQNLMSVDDINACNYILKKNDIVFARTGNSTGRSYFYDGSDGVLVYAGFLIKFSIDDNKVNPRILKYYTHSKPYFDWVHSFDTGGTRGNINAKTYGTMPIMLPPRFVQDKIVSILSSLDDKIELNRRINENLEQQAQALFKSWFVDFEPFKNGKFVDSELGKIPEGWKIGILSDIANITMGQSPRGTSYNEIGNGITFYQGRADFGNRFPSIRLFTTEPSRYAEPHSVLLSVRAPVGDINIAVEKCCIGRGLASILSKDNHQSFILYTMYSLKKELDKFNSEGTVFGSINRFSIENLKIVIPPIDVMDEFEHLVSKIDDLLLYLFQETTRLEQLRDILLPRLMSGELKITDIE